MHKKVFTIPNILSCFRIILAFSYLIIFMTQQFDGKREMLIAILVVSALTDWLDGKIARKFNMVSDIGKVLDPIADKLTQGALLICLMSQYQTVKYVFVLFLIKETCLGITGLSIIHNTGKNEGAKWYGKVSTAVFYTVMVILALFPQIPKLAGEYLLIACGCFMLLSFVLYGCHYHEIIKNERINKSMEEAELVH